ncbi:uncharacterized protein LOC131673046 [Phymastichus coffea]|uniref:uncharacterized protein LOC131667582 n=1 Tax=Phymastichus coffea TaxID=108790 RepID=UPI00273C97A5|nr:uncharacterized protein LOC131667582 [Phymastichus coffea]XP_058806080.1 uncharacterized protein LOC131672702 [Phymastichus coffea]XP_058806681.1 uncharacterized protein LOC131673046 [Phymastichus coffea]
MPPKFGTRTRRPLHHRPELEFRPTEDGPPPKPELVIISSDEEDDHDRQDQRATAPSPSFSTSSYIMEIEEEILKEKARLGLQDRLTLAAKRVAALVPPAEQTAADQKIFHLAGLIEKTGGNQPSGSGQSSDESGIVLLTRGEGLDSPTDETRPTSRDPTPETTRATVVPAIRGGDQPEDSQEDPKPSQTERSSQHHPHPGWLPVTNTDDRATLIRGIEERRIRGENGRRRRYNLRRHLEYNDLVSVMDRSDASSDEPGPPTRTSPPRGIRPWINYEARPRDTGAGFGNLRAIPTDPTIDPPGRSCFNCWMPGHSYRTCPRPTEANQYCGNCGRRGVGVENCPRCAEEYWHRQDRTTAGRLTHHVAHPEAPPPSYDEVVQPATINRPGPSTGAIPRPPEYRRQNRHNPSHSRPHIEAAQDIEDRLRELDKLRQAVEAMAAAERRNLEKVRRNRSLNRGRESSSD